MCGDCGKNVDWCLWRGAMALKKELMEMADFYHRQNNEKR